MPNILGQRNRTGVKRVIQTFVKVEVPRTTATATCAVSSCSPSPITK